MRVSADTLFVTTCHDFCHVTFSPAISKLGEAAESIWRWVNMVMVRSSLCFTTIVHGSFMFSFKKSPFTLEFQMPRGKKVSRLLATSSKFLVANAQFCACETLSPSAKLSSAKVGTNVYLLLSNGTPKAGGSCGPSTLMWIFGSLVVFWRCWYDIT